MSHCVRHVSALLGAVSGDRLNDIGEDPGIDSALYEAAKRNGGDKTMRTHQAVVSHVGRVLDVVERGGSLGRDSIADRLARSWQRSLNNYRWTRPSSTCRGWSPP